MAFWTGGVGTGEAQKELGSGCFRKSTWDRGRALVVEMRGRGPRGHLGALLVDT